MTAHLHASQALLAMHADELRPEQACCPIQRMSATSRREVCLPSGAMVGLHFGTKQSAMNAYLCEALEVQEASAPLICKRPDLEQNARQAVIILLVVLAYL